jgi:gas vesicle protein
MEKDSDSSIVWFIAGAVTGVAIAVLYAPQGGKETRRILHKTTQEGRDAVEASGKELMERGRDLYDRGRKIADEAAELFERGRKLVQN